MTAHTCQCHQPPVANAATAIDPICQMSVDTATATHTAEHDGTMYYFCAPGCRRAFLADPARYLALAAVPAPPGTAMLQIGRRPTTRENARRP